MKKINYLFSLLLGILLSTNAVLAQDITEKDMKDQLQRLKEDPKDFAANFIVGGFYYNLANEPQTEASKMKLVEYLTQGQPFEQKKQTLLKKALPYFENAYAINKSDTRITNVLKTIYQNLGEVKLYRRKSEEIQAQLQQKLDKIEFKAIEE